MSIYDIKNDTDNCNRYPTAKPLAPDIKISPKNSMVMFNLNGTLIRNGILLRKTLKHIAQKAIDQGFGIKSEVERSPIAENLNSISLAVSRKLEEHIKNNKAQTSDIDSILKIEHILPIIEDSIASTNTEAFLSKDQNKSVSLKIANYIHDNLVKDIDMKKSINQAINIYDQQVAVGNQSTIMPEVINMMRNMASLGVPVAIVSNKTQEFVNKASDRIIADLPYEVQQKIANKEWYFSKIGLQRDDDDDVLLPIKPAPDSLIASHVKADKFNAKTEQKPIKNIIFVGQSEGFDMRAADNLQRSNYAIDNGITVYKLLCKYDDPAKKIHDDTLINCKSTLKHIEEVDKRLSSVFMTE